MKKINIADITQVKNFEYKLRIEANDLGSSETYFTSLKNLLIAFKEHKKDISVGLPLTEYRTINNHIYMLLLDIDLPADIIMRRDFNFIIGYHELKYLYRFMFKDEPLMRDGFAYYYKDFSKDLRERLENKKVRVKIYEEKINVNSFMRRYYDYNCSLGNSSNKGGDLL